MQRQQQAQKKSNKVESEGNRKGESKSNCRRLGVIKAFQLKQATRRHTQTHIRTQTHTHTDTCTMKSWNILPFPFAVLFYQQLAASSIALIKRQKLQTLYRLPCFSLSPSLLRSWYLSLSLRFFLSSSCQSMWASQKAILLQFIYCIPLNCWHSSNLLKGESTFKANY